LQVAWIKSDSKAILAIHDHVITNNEKISVTHNDKDTWTLKIHQVTQADAGSYMCQINSRPMIEKVSVTLLLDCLSDPLLSKSVADFIIFLLIDYVQNE
jgi:hypothetical protein